MCSDTESLPPRRCVVTVVIRDDAPLIHCNDCPSYRTVRFALADEQASLLELRGMESVSRVILEEEPRNHA